MSFGEAIKSVFSQYAGFSGRARRSEYWFFYLFTSIVSSVLSGIASAAGGDGGSALAIIPGIFALAILVPSLAVLVRRLHDVGKSGWWVLIAFVPCIGEILLLIWCIKDSEPGFNQYGPNPKESGSEFGGTM